MSKINVPVDLFNEVLRDLSALRSHREYESLHELDRRIHDFDQCRYAPSSEIREPEEWLEGVRVSIEGGWLCVRTAKGWLLWNAKIADMPDTGLLLEDAMKLAKAEYLENGQ